MLVINRCMAVDILLVSVESMRTSNIWAPVIASLPETHWHGVNNPSGDRHPSQFKRVLAYALGSKGRDSKVLSPAVVRRLQACFSKLVRLQS